MLLVTLSTSWASLHSSCSVSQWNWHFPSATTQDLGHDMTENIIIADISSLRNRVLMTILPNTLPGCLNVWVGGDVATAVLEKASWRWGFGEYYGSTEHLVLVLTDTGLIGMFAIITPVLAIPIIAALATGSRARKVTDLEEIQKVHQITVVEKLAWKERSVSMFWQLDLIGLLLFIGGTGMFLVTITLANNKTKSWSDGKS
jgi:SIT family siderophore-iron:H+ symporter-like MFS transporter